ncbi:MAG TPA: hypothetical protein VKF38_11295 [Anaerolineaceae bacterium]|nr:hypothetical protein [Anaerolineaceae bacterium]
MRITRETLTKAARDFAKQRSQSDRRLVCIYLTGSLLEEEPLLGGTTDIDLVVVHDDEPPINREIVRLTDEVHIDVAHRSAADYRQPRHLRLDPWLGAFLCQNPIVLYDTQHWFEFTQAGVCAQFYQPDYVLQRARPLAESARQKWMELHNAEYNPGPIKLLAYLKALENAANSIACLNGVPLTERRFMVNFPDRAQAIQRPGLSAGLLDLFLNQPISDEDWLAWLKNWKIALKTASQMENCPPRIHPCRELYYERAIETLKTDNLGSAMWILLRTWTLALLCLANNESSNQAWQKACQKLALDETQFEPRIVALDAYLDSVEEALDVWSAQMGI